MKLALFFAVTVLQSAVADASECPFADWKPPGEDDGTTPDAHLADLVTLLKHL